MATRRARGARQQEQHPQDEQDQPQSTERTDALTMVSVPSVSIGVPPSAIPARPLASPRLALHAKPKHVCIVAMGASASAFVQLVSSLGGIHAVADEIWTINATAALFQHHRAFVMDDVKHIITREATEGKKVAQGILRWLPHHPGPVYSSRAYPEWPALVEFPLRDALQAVGGLPYLNTSVAHAIAFAMALGVEELSLYGCDFTYPNLHAAEAGRGCVEYLLGLYCGKGLKLNIPSTTTLMDANVPEHERLYGYHEPVHVDVVDGQVVVAHGDRPAPAGAPVVAPAVEGAAIP